jgi:hypothetical protein
VFDSGAVFCGDFEGDLSEGRGVGDFGGTGGVADRVCVGDGFFGEDEVSEEIDVRGGNV